MILQGNMAYSKKYNYIIIWSAKSGCTYFRQLFLILHKKELIKDPTHLWHTLCNDFKVPKEINLSNTKKIILSRNPYYRVVSIFCNKYCGGPGHYVLQSKFQLNKCTFRCFVKKLLKLKQNGNLNCIDPHISEQSYLNDSNTHIVHLEDFDRSIIDTYKKINLDCLIPKIKLFLNSKVIFKNKRFNTNENNYVYDKEYNKNSTIFPHYKYFYDKNLQHMVYKLYENDFINFKYNKNLPF